MSIQQINDRIKELKSGPLDQKGRDELAVLYTRRQKEMLNEQIRQELIAKNTGTPASKKGEVAPTPAKPAEADTSFHITGLSIDKQDKIES